MRRHHVITLSCLLGAGASSTPAAPKADPPQELGRVKWARNLDAALATAKQSGKPVLLLFQEIPGCQTCKDFGRSPLSHPLLVEAIETEFVAVAIYNNRPGADAEALKRYDEPAWNYPVMRFVDAGGADILSRRDRIWSTGDVAARMVEALEAAEREVPQYLQLAAVESASRPTRHATFSMHCYWEGEAQLGALDGVVGTRAGWIDDAEVVEVVYDPVVLEAEELASHARSFQCAPVTGTIRDAKPSDRKYALTRSPLRYLPLTPMQATKVNADLRAGRDPTRCLSPRQKELAGRISGALKVNADAMAGLERPDTLDALPSYLDALVARLETAKS